MVPSYRAFGANRASRRPSQLIAVRVQKRRGKAVPLTPASKEPLKKDAAGRRGLLRLSTCLAVSALTVRALSTIAAPAGSPLAYTTLNFGTSGTFLTGIRGNNIVGNYVIPGTTETGGSHNISTRIWTLFPEVQQTAPTSWKRSFPRLMAPGFGSQFGILRAVGSYETQSSSPYDFGYLYDGAGGRTEI
jgi:hypothetical protein